MVIWFPEQIRYDCSFGTAEIVCPGCRERVVADVHEKRKGQRKVGRCRLCGIFAELPDAIPFTKADPQQYIAVGGSPPQVPPFVVLMGSPYEVVRAGGSKELTKELALLGAISISLKWHRPRVFWSRTVFLIVVAFPLGLGLSAVAAINNLPWIFYLANIALFTGVAFSHQRCIRLRTLAEMGPYTTRFVQHFQVSVDQLVQIGLRQQGDFKKAARFLKRNF